MISVHSVGNAFSPFVVVACKALHCSPRFRKSPSSSFKIINKYRSLTQFQYKDTTRCGYSFFNVATKIKIKSWGIFHQHKPRSSSFATILPFPKCVSGWYQLHQLPRTSIPHILPSLISKPTTEVGLTIHYFFGGQIYKRVEVDYAV